MRKADKTNGSEWVTEADIIVGFDELSEDDKNFRRSRKVWLDPDLIILRAVYRAVGVHIIVDIDGCKFRFDCPRDAWHYVHAATGVCTVYTDLANVIERGDIWRSGDVSVWLVNGI